MVFEVRGTEHEVWAQRFLSRDFADAVAIQVARGIGASGAWSNPFSVDYLLQADCPAGGSACTLTLIGLGWPEEFGVGLLSGSAQLTVFVTTNSPGSYTVDDALFRLSMRGGQVAENLVRRPFRVGWRRPARILDVVRRGFALTCSGRYPNAPAETERAIIPF